MSQDPADFGTEQPDAGVTDQEILAFIARIQSGGGRRRYLQIHRPDGSAGDSQ